MKRLTIRSGSFNGVACSPDGRFLAAGSREGEVFPWQTADGKELARLAFGPDGLTVAAAGHRSTVVICDVEEA